MTDDFESYVLCFACSQERESCFAFGNLRVRLSYGVDTVMRFAVKLPGTNLYVNSSKEWIMANKEQRNG